MKKVIMFGAAGLLSLSLLTGMADSTTAEAKAKSHRCSIMKGCRVTGKHHSKKHRLKKHHTTKHPSKTYRCVSRHSGNHHSGSHHSGHHR